MHRGRFVWTLTPPLSGRRKPRPGPARVCVCVPCLAGSGEPASWARSSAPHHLFGSSWFALCLFGLLRAGVALFVVVVGFFFLSFSPSPPSLRPRCVLLCVFSWDLAPPPLSFWASPPHVVSGVFHFRVAWGLCAPPPLLLFFVFVSSVSCFSLFRFFFHFAAGCAVWGGFVCLGPSGVPVFASVVLSLSLLCVRWLVLRGVRCWAWLSSAVSWRVLVSCFGGAVLVWPPGSPPCGSAWCVLVFRCPVLCSVALCCRVVVCCRALPFVCVFCLHLLFVSCRCASAVCVLGCRAVCSLSSPPCAVLCPAVLVPFRCAVRVVCTVSGSWCCWFLVSLPFVGGLLVALVAQRCRFVVFVGFGARVWSGCCSASSLCCPAPLCCVLWRRAAVWCCAVVPCLFLLFFSLLVALVSCCSSLVLGSGPVPGRFCFCALPEPCCAGVPASLLSVRCSLALAGLAGVLCCCLLCLSVCCRAWLSSVVSWWVLVAPGVVSRWRAVVCPWVLCCAVLLRVPPPGVALFCAVLFRCAPFGAAARCVVSWGAVRCLGVLCLLAPCFVLSPRAMCVLLWCVAAWCCSPLYSVPCAPWGVVLCVSCRLRPVRCCFVTRSPSVPCSPVLCPVVLCCRVVPWCPVLLPCWVCFSRRCGCTYLKNRCKIS